MKSGINKWCVIQNKNLIAYCFAEYKATQNLEATQVMEMLMVHLFTQDLNLRLLFKKIQVLHKVGNYKTTKDSTIQDKNLLQPHDSNAESALQRVDLDFQNGFKVRTTDAGAKC